MSDPLNDAQEVSETTATIGRTVISVASHFGIELFSVGKPDHHVQPIWGQRVAVGDIGSSQGET